MWFRSEARQSSPQCCKTPSPLFLHLCRPSTKCRLNAGSVFARKAPTQISSATSGHRVKLIAMASRLIAMCPHTFHTHLVQLLSPHLLSLCNFFSVSPFSASTSAYILCFCSWPLSQILLMHLRMCVTTADVLVEACELKTRTAKKKQSKENNKYR